MGGVSVLSRVGRRLGFHPVVLVSGTKDGSVQEKDEERLEHEIKKEDERREQEKEDVKKELQLQCPNIKLND